LIIFSGVTTLPYSTLIFNYLTIDARRYVGILLLSLFSFLVLFFKNLFGSYPY
jgi:hypothetical protein